MADRGVRRNEAERGQIDLHVELARGEFPLPKSDRIRG